jgi:hypothetical protein
MRSMRRTVTLIAIGAVEHSMRKPEIQTLISLVFCGFQIRLLLLRTHAPPNSLAFFIRVHIIHLRSDENQEVPRTDRNQNLVTSTIQRLVIISVDILADNAASLHCHVVQRGSNGARAYGSGVARRDCNKDGVDVWMADEEGRKDPSRPG